MFKLTTIMLNAQLNSSSNISTNFSAQIGGRNCSENLLNIFFCKNSKIECCEIEQIWLFESALLWHFV
jgi:hypothetical protein